MASPGVHQHQPNFVWSRDSLYPKACDEPVIKNDLRFLESVFNALDKVRAVTGSDVYLASFGEVVLKLEQPHCMHRTTDGLKKSNSLLSLLHP